jgi:hypothetical protein
MREILIRSVAVLAALLMVSAAQAATTYQYSGPNFESITSDDNPPAGSYTTAMNLTITITVGAGAPVPTAGSGFANLTSNVLSYSFNDGRQTLTESNSTLRSFLLAADLNGDLFGHQASVDTGPGGLMDGDPTGLNVGDQIIFMRTELGPDPSGVGDFASVLQCVGGSCLFSPTEFAVDSARTLSTLPNNWSVAPVPVPAAAWLFASALGLLGWARRKQA